MCVLCNYYYYYVNIMTLLFFILYVYLYTYNSCEFLSCKRWQFIFDYVLRLRYEVKNKLCDESCKSKATYFFIGCNTFYYYYIHIYIQNIHTETLYSPINIHIYI